MRLEKIVRAVPKRVQRGWKGLSKLGHGCSFQGESQPRNRVPYGAGITNKGHRLLSCFKDVFYRP